MQSRVSPYLEQEVLSATGLQLVHLLYRAAISQLRDARRNLAQKNIPAKCTNITKACDIVSELQCSLDRSAGGDLAERLHGLYGHMLCQLLEANLTNSDKLLADVLGLLCTLDEAWNQLATQRPEPVLSGLPPAVFSGYDALDAPANSWSL